VRPINPRHEQTEMSETYLPGVPPHRRPQDPGPLRRPAKPRPAANGEYRIWDTGREYLCIAPDGSIDGDFPDRDRAISGTMYLNESRLGLDYGRHGGDPGELGDDT
jgi:hypothetical protein